MKKANILALAIIMGMAISACGGGVSRLSSVHIIPPEQSVIGTYRLTGFGLEQMATGEIVDDETNHVPWSGDMTITQTEIIRNKFATPFDEYTRTGYKFWPDGDFWGFGTNGSYEFDGLFIIFNWTGKYYPWGWCYKYEFWEKVSD